MSDDQINLPVKIHPKSKFTRVEDIALTGFVKRYGADDWTSIAAAMGNRTVRQCKERWMSYLSPEIGNGPWTTYEDALLLLKVHEYGFQWRIVARFFQSRTDINVKSRWHLLQRRLKREIQTQLHRRQHAPAGGVALQIPPQNALAGSSDSQDAFDDTSAWIEDSAMEYFHSDI
jgi:hypothetical protein